MERDTPVVENGPIEGVSNLQGTQQSLPEENNCSQLEDDCLIARARAVGVDYEFNWAMKGCHHHHHYHYYYHYTIVLMRLGAPLLGLAKCIYYPRICTVIHGTEVRLPLINWSDFKMTL